MYESTEAEFTYARAVLAACPSAVAEDEHGFRGFVLHAVHTVLVDAAGTAGSPENAIRRALALLIVSEVM